MVWIQVESDGLGAELAEGLDDADEGLLEEVFGDVLLADEAEDEIDEGLFDPLHELAVGGGVSPRASPEQLFLQVHQVSLSGGHYRSPYNEFTSKGLGIPTISALPPPGLKAPPESVENKGDDAGIMPSSPSRYREPGCGKVRTRCRVKPSADREPESVTMPL